MLLLKLLYLILPLIIFCFIMKKRTLPSPPVNPSLDERESLIKNNCGRVMYSTKFEYETPFLLFANINGMNSLNFHARKEWRILFVTSRRCWTNLSPKRLSVSPSNRLPVASCIGLYTGLCLG